MGAIKSRQQGLDQFNLAIDQLNWVLPNLSGHVILDNKTRSLYQTEIRKMANSLKQQVRAGTITWEEAAIQACKTRNEILFIMRKQTTPVGLAFSQRLKQGGRLLDELINEHTEKLFPNKTFLSLNLHDKDQVYLRIVQSSARARSGLSLIIKRLNTAAHGLIVVSVAVSVWSVATSEHRLKAAEHEIVTSGASLAGGVAGGASAGWVCGPAAPYCVTVGAFVGGVLAAFGVGHLWPMS